MALETQLLDIPLTGGVSSKISPVIVGKGKLLALNNGTFNKSGDIQRRDPWTILGGTGTINPTELIAYGSQLLAIDSLTNRLYSYSPTAAALEYGGQPPYFSTGLDAIQRGNFSIRGIDSATIGQYTAYTWIQTLGATTQVWMEIFDEAAGNVSVGTYTTSGGIDSACGTKVCAAGSNFICTYVASNGTTINVFVLSSTGSLVTSPTAIVTDATHGLLLHPYSDLISFGASQALLVYTSSKTSTTVGALVLSSTGAVAVAEITAVASAVLTGSVSGLSCVAFSSSAALLIAGDSGAAKVWTAVLSLSGSVLSVANAAAASVISYASGTTVAGCIDPASGLCRVFASPILTGVQGSAVVGSWATMTVSSSNVVTNLSGSGPAVNNSISASSGNEYSIGPYISGKPFAIGGSVFCPIQIQGQLQTTNYVVDTSGFVVAMGQYASAWYDSGSYLQLPSSPIAGPGYVSLPVITQGTLSFVGGVKVVPQGVSRWRLNYGRGANTWHAVVGQNVFFSGSYLAQFDGLQITEAGFFYFPEVTWGTASGSGTQPGTFQVCAVYEWVDNQGQRHQSAPSVPFTVTLTGTQSSIIMSAQSLQIGFRRTNCSVVFYRTTNAGTTFYRVNSPTSPLANAWGTGVVTYTDTTPRSTATSDTITSNEPLYTTGGTLPNDVPPACNAIATFGGRLVFSNAEDPQDWRYSQYPIPGYGLQFNEALLFGRTPPDAGQISAIGVLDDKCVIFTPTRSLWCSGSGPNSAGLGSTFSAPQLLTNDTGCIDQRSLALLPDLTNLDGVTLQAQGGLCYQSKHGYYMLTRSLTENYVGEGLDSALSGGVAVQSAVVLQDKHQLRLTYGSGGVAVFDYLMGQWATFSSSAGGYLPQCGVVWNGLWTFGASGHFIAQDGTGPGQDGGVSPIVTSWISPWYRVSSFQGFQRARRAAFFGPYGAGSTISITPRYDYDTSRSFGPLSVSSASVVTGDSQRWQFRYHLPVQKFEAIQFVVTDTPTAGSMAGVGFTGLTLELGVKRGGFKLPAGQSF